MTERLLRVAVASALLYPPIAAWFDPLSWVGYIPAVIQNLPLETVLMLHIVGVFEIVLALWILFGKSVWVPSLIAAAFLLLIVACNFSQLDILFRDVSLALAALALAAKSYEAGRISM